MTEYYINSTKYSLQERMTKRGKVYDIVFRIVTLDGEEKQKKMSGYASKTLAKQAYTDFVTEKCLLVKNNPIKKKYAGKDELTIAELAVMYLAAIQNQNKGSTLYEKEKIFKLIYIPQLGDKKLKDLNEQVLYNWQDNLWNMKNPKTGEFYSFKYLSKLRSYFSAFLTWCATRQGGKNYLENIPKPKRRAPKKDMLFWTREEFNKFIAVVDNPLYHAMFTTLFFTGRRKGEILALTKEDITPTSIKFNKSLTRKTISGKPYEITSTKTELVSATPICSVLQKELEKYDGDAPFYFGGNSPITDNTLKRAFDKYADIAGVKRIRIHDLRHSFVSMCIHLGATIPVIADLIGDTIAQVTKTYAHMYDSDKMDIIKKIK